ncbi:hypothetical protein FN846DRAFT_942532 [Sphaerosporella brunnea]|uniref:Uncharacterized protein n=1 Tax=Sphaerosporella brunnea TaxID=1250544 RepID=A0A5J5F1F2_9PEZI|nr:hypothetical protein FN846DRAFT_942532 [Sphaerosporella brunnea]
MASTRAVHKPIRMQGSKGQANIPTYADPSQPSTYDESFGFSTEFVSVIHGKYEHGGSSHATLLLLDFKVPSSAPNGQRYYTAFVSVEFTKADASDSSPVVTKLEPFGERTYDGQAITIGALGVGSGFRHKTSDERTRLKGEFQTTAATAERVRNAAKWIFSDNPDTQDGIPTSLRAAILVKTPTTKFNAHFHFQAKVQSERVSHADFVETFGTGKPIVSGVHVQNLDANNMLAFDLKSL